MLRWPNNEPGERGPRGTRGTAGGEVLYLPRGDGRIILDHCPRAHDKRAAAAAVLELELRDPGAVGQLLTESLGSGEVWGGVRLQISGWAQPRRAAVLRAPGKAAIRAKRLAPAARRPSRGVPSQRRGPSAQAKQMLRDPRHWRKVARLPRRRRAAQADGTKVQFDEAAKVANRVALVGPGENAVRHAAGSVNVVLQVKVNVVQRRAAHAPFQERLVDGEHDDRQAAIVFPAIRPVGRPDAVIGLIPNVRVRREEQRGAGHVHLPPVAVR